MTQFVIRSEDCIITTVSNKVIHRDTTFKLLKTNKFLHPAEPDPVKSRNEELDGFPDDGTIVNPAPFPARVAESIKKYVTEVDLNTHAKSCLYKIPINRNWKNYFKDEEVDLSLRYPMCNRSNVFRERSLLSGLFFLSFFPAFFNKKKYRSLHPLRTQVETLTARLMNVGNRFNLICIFVKIGPVS